jgi:hypothetical protein
VEKPEGKIPFRKPRQGQQGNINNFPKRSALEKFGLVLSGPE